MALTDELFETEEGFWLKGDEHFLAWLNETCLLIFPQAGQMHGVYSREQIALTATSPGRWRNLRMTDRNLIRPAADTAVISYRAEATRFDGEAYAALIGSTYVRRSGEWKLAVHQHSPI